MNDGQIACCAYVSLGFGTPQMQHFLASLQDHYRPRKPVLVCEPHSDAIPERHRNLEQLSFHRVVSPNWRAPYWYLDRGAGEAEYREAAARWISVHRPEMLVLTAVSQFEPLRDSGHRPRHLVYYAFESWEKHELAPRSLLCHDELRKDICLAIFPEATRSRFYRHEFGCEDTPTVMAYNAPPLRRGRIRAASQRNGRILMQGTVQWGFTFPEFLLNTQKPAIPIDVYGPIYGAESRILRIEEVARVFGFRYFGFIPNSDLARVRDDYSYVLVMWKPVNVNSLNACPNKLFEAIASGVPPICAPHPQCVSILEKYDCGILMRDWSFGSYCDALEQAASLRGTPRYRELTRNCVRAHREELHWEAQFAKIAAHLPAPSGRSFASSRRPGPPRLVLADPDLGDGNGRAFRRGLRILAAARRLGLEPVALVNRVLRQRLPEFVTAHPVFWHDGQGRNTTYPDLPRDPDAAARFVRVLRSALERERLRATDHIYLPTAPDDFLLGLAEWLSSDSTGRAGVWHLLIDNEGDGPSEAGARALRMMNSALAGNRLRLYCETSELARETSRSAGVPFRILPMPAFGGPGCRRPAERRQSGFSVAYIGEAQEEAAFLAMGSLVERTLGLFPDRPIRFEVLCRPALAGAAVLDEIQRLRLLGAPSGRVTLHLPPVSARERLALLRRSDVVLDLSDPQRHRRRCSDVFTEALAHGRVVLAARGSWMAARLPAQSPWVYARPAEIPAMLLRIVGDWPRHRDLATRLGREWRRTHTAENLVRTLTGALSEMSDHRPASDRESGDSPLRRCS